MPESMGDPLVRHATNLFSSNTFARGYLDKMDQMQRDDHENRYASRYEKMSPLELKEDFDEPSVLKALNSRMCELRCVPAPNHEGLVHLMARRDGKMMCECCHAAFYCSPECQKKDWLVHRAKCGQHGLARRYRGEATWIAAVMWADRTNGLPVWFPLCVRYDDSVDDVKRKIRDRFGVALGAQYLATSRGAMIGSADTLTGVSDDAGTLEGMFTGSLADFEVVRGQFICVSTENYAVPRPTCERCRQCIGGACRLEFGPRLEHAHKYPEIRQDVPEVGRNDPCPCGSGKKYKKCCGR